MDEPVPAASAVEGWGPLRFRRNQVRLWASVVLAAALGAFAAGFYYARGREARVGRGPEAGQELGLRIVGEADGSLRATWNPSSAAVRAARGAALHVVDGKLRYKLPLPDLLLRTGWCAITHVFGDLAVTLEVETAEGRVRETARWQGPVKPAVSVSGSEGKAPGGAGEAVPERGVEEAVVPVAARAAEQERAEGSPQGRRRRKSNEFAAGVWQKEQGAARPARGGVLWTGHLPANAVLSVEAGKPSTGHLHGRLPGVEVRIAAYLVEVSMAGLTVYSARPVDAERMSTQRGTAETGWMPFRFQYDVQRAMGIELLSRPAAENEYQGLSVRAGTRPVAAVLIEWEAAGGAGSSRDGQATFTEKSK